MMAIMGAKRQRRDTAGARQGARGVAVSLLVAGLVCVACDGSLIELSGGTGGGGGPPLVIYLTSGPPEALPAEEAAAWAWLQGNSAFTARQLQMIDLSNTELPRDAVLWWHYAAEESLPSIAVTPEVLSPIAAHLRSGGSALLSLIAATYVVPLGIEPLPPDTVSTRASFVGGGAELGGLQSRGGHPVLERFWGSVFSAADIHYAAHPAVAYTGGRWPRTGRVWAVHQNEHGVDPSTKVGIEYADALSGGGTVLTLGAHCYFDDRSNHNREQLEQLVSNALGYLGSRANAESPGAGIAVPVADTSTPPALDGQPPYWEPVPTTFAGLDVAPSRLPPEADPGTALNRVQGSLSNIDITRYDDSAPFTLPTPRAVVLGSQLGRVEQFRVHPVALLSDLRLGIVRPDRGVTWLDEGAGAREFTARPEGDELYYNDGELEIWLYLTVDRRYPALVGLVAVRSPAAVDLIATWKAEPGRQMPGTPAARQPRIGWDDGAQAVVWQTAAGLTAKAGFGRATPLHIIGFDPLVHLDEAGLVAPREVPEAGADGADAEATAAGEQPSTAPGLAPAETGEGAGAAAEPRQPAIDLGRVALQVRIAPGVPAVVPLVAVGGGDDEVDVDDAFAELIAAPGRPWVDNARHFREFLGNGTMGLLAPEPQFEEVFKWAKTGIEALRVTYPGLGTAIASGYGDDRRRRDWSTPVNAVGGSGALWASMAADAYGDRRLAAATLQMMARYQSIDGGIPDAVAPGWRVLDDGVGTTPLFLIALDNHVRTWGDLELLEQLWPTVERALDHLLAADADGDGLIDGAGRLDRYSDDRAVRTPIHLAALWGAALEAVARLAEARGGDAPATAEAFTRVRTALNDAFWNPNARRFNFAKRVDGSFAAAGTVLPAVPMAFGLLDPGIANAALDALAGAEMSRDWGVALTETPTAPTEAAGEAVAVPALVTPLVDGPSPQADVVSPLFTGWAALAEYANQRPEAGFAHLATNLMLLEHGNVGYAVDGFETDSFVLRSDTQHAAASQAMTLLPVVWGMLGIRPDAVNRQIAIRPQLPAGWNRVNVDQVRVGNSEFRLQIIHTAGQTQFVTNGWRGDRDLEIRLSAQVPIEVDISLDDNVAGLELVDSETADDGAYRVATAVVRPTAGVDRGVVSFNHGPYPRLIAPATSLRPGEVSSNLRVVRAAYLGGVMRIKIEGLPGRRYTLRLATPWNVSRVTGAPDADFDHPEPGIARLFVTIPGSGTRYRPIDLEVAFAR